MDNAYTAGQKLLRGSYTSYTPTGASLFKKAGAWYLVPEPGDVVYFYNSSLARIGHVGIVAFVDKTKKTFKTIEGNTSSTEFSTNGGCCAMHEYSYTGIGGKSRVQGFGRPVFSDETCTVEDLLQTAMAEIGYEEKASNKDLDDPHKNAGKNNYTKYGEWYGLNPAQWCQMFVSWCAYMGCKRHQEMLLTGWRKDGEDWTYRIKGQLVRGQWLEVGGRWYVFDEAGRMIRGWFKSKDGWYYLGEDGGMLAGQWVKDNGLWYYLTKSGLMAEEAYVKSKSEPIYYWVNGSGVWEPSWNTAHPDLSLFYVAE